MTHKSTSRAFILILVFGLVSALNGCISLLWPKTIDVTDKPAWWGQLEKGEVLQLTRDILLNGQTLAVRAYKLTDDYNSSLIFGGSITVEQYRASPEKFWPELHLLPKGTRFRCTKLVRYYKSEDAGYTVWGEILDGEYKGKAVSLIGITGDPDVKGSLRLTTTILKPAS